MSPERPPGPHGREGAAESPVAVRLAVLDEVEVTVEKLVAGGDGFARVDGVPLFVPRSAPGDRLRVRVAERHPDYGRAEIVAVLAPGPGRREPPCPYFTRCGGCDLQHLEDSAQLRGKVEATVETLVRLGGLRLSVPPAIVAGSPWGYRLRTQLHVLPAAAPGGPAAVGYFARGSHELVAIDRCPILHPAIESLLPRLPALLAALGEAAPRRLDLAAGAGDALSVAPRVEGLPHGDVELALPDPSGGPELSLVFDARSFFQAHRGLVAELVAHAIGAWEGEVAYDLYAGVGLFALPLARRYRRVVAVEGERVAARHARNNARRNRLPGVEVAAQAVETWIGGMPAGAERAIVDPPRGGLSRAVRHALFRLRPKRLTYVSCHAATLARDLKSLKGAYEVESLALLDLFPQTGHLEAVVQLVAREDDGPGSEADREGECGERDGREERDLDRKVERHEAGALGRARGEATPRFGGPRPGPRPGGRPGERPGSRPAGPPGPRGGHDRPRDRGAPDPSGRPPGLDRPVSGSGDRPARPRPGQPERPGGPGRPPGRGPGRRPPSGGPRRPPRPDRG